MKVKSLITDTEYGIVIGEIYEAFFTAYTADNDRHGAEIMIFTPTHGWCFMVQGEYEVTEL